MSRVRERFSVFVFAALLVGLFVALAFLAGWIVGRVLL